MQLLTYLLAYLLTCLLTYLHGLQNDQSWRKFCERPRSNVISEEGGDWDPETTFVGI